jgi:hypothetical protein
MANPRTVQQYKALMRHAIGNVEPASGVDLLEVLNDALRELYAFHDWEFARRLQTTGLNLVSGQSYITLPSDFGTLKSIDTTVNDIITVSKVSLEELERLRSTIYSGTFDFFVALAFPSQTSASVRPATPQLQIWPTPTSNISNAMRIQYIAKAVDLSADTDVPNIPKEFESALATLARGKLMMWERDGDINEYQSAIAMLTKMKEADGSSEDEVGTITGGAAEPFLQQATQVRPFDRIGIRGA